MQEEEELGSLPIVREFTRRNQKCKALDVKMYLLHESKNEFISNASANRWSGGRSSFTSIVVSSV